MLKEEAVLQYGHVQRPAVEALGFAANSLHRKLDGFELALNHAFDASMQALHMSPAINDSLREVMGEVLEHCLAWGARLQGECGFALAGRQRNVGNLAVGLA